LPSDICFDDAVKRAEDLDAYFAEKGCTIGPLHGLPVSIKDHIMVQGLDTATGYISWCYRTVADKDAVAVNILKQAGAVIYVKTNNPQTLLSLETDNNIFGKTLNPFNRDLTPGGSSGGESALIAFHGSPLGIGTDIGGSIRLPAACTGLYGFKASVGRIPHAGLLGSHDGMDAIVGVLGPLARSARDLSLFCKVMLEYKPWLVEPPLLEIPWKEDVVNGAGLPSRLSFGILWDDGVVKPHPPIQAALQKLKQQLLEAGHEVIDWVPIDHKYAWELITKLYFLDGGEEYRDVLAESGEPPTAQTEWILSQVPNRGCPFSISEIFKLNLEREKFRVKLAEHWNQTKNRTTTGRPIDAIISPTASSLAPKHGGTRWWGYTSYWNLADYPAVVFPVGRYDPQHGADLNSHENDTASAVTPSQDGRNVYDTRWETSSYKDFPICLQLIGRRLNEEKVLGMLNILEHATKAKANGSDVMS